MPINDKLIKRLDSHIAELKSLVGFSECRGENKLCLRKHTAAYLVFKNDFSEEPVCIYLSEESARRHVEDSEERLCTKKVQFRI